MCKHIMNIGVIISNVYLNCVRHIFLLISCFASIVLCATLFSSVVCIHLLATNQWLSKALKISVEYLNDIKCHISYNFHFFICSPTITVFGISTFPALSHLCEILKLVLFSNHLHYCVIYKMQKLPWRFCCAKILYIFVKSPWLGFHYLTGASWVSFLYLHAIRSGIGSWFMHVPVGEG